MLSLTGFAHIFIKLRLLYLKSLEKNSFLASGQATGQGSILVYKNSQRFAVKSLATRITVICTGKTDKITYVLLVKIVTDVPINSPNFYR